MVDEQVRHRLPGQPPRGWPSRQGHSSTLVFLQDAADLSSSHEPCAHSGAVICVADTKPHRAVCSLWSHNSIRARKSAPASGSVTARVVRVDRAAPISRRLVPTLQKFAPPPSQVNIIFPRDTSCRPTLVPLSRSRPTISQPARSGANWCVLCID